MKITTLENFDAVVLDFDILFYKFSLLFRKRLRDATIVLQTRVFSFVIKKR